MNMLIAIVVTKSERGSTVIQLGRNGVGNVLDLLEFLLEVISGSRLTLRVNPTGGLLNGVQERLLVIGIQLATETVRVTELGLEAVDVGREGVESFDVLLLGFVLSGKCLGLDNHTVNLLLSETSLLVGDSNRLEFAGTLVGSGNLHDAIGVNLEFDLDLGNTTRGRRNISELKLAKKVVVLSEVAFTLKDLDQDSRVPVGGGGEDLALASGDNSVTGDEPGHDTTNKVLDQVGRLIVGGDGEDLALASGDNSVTGDELGHDTTDGLNTERERVDFGKDNITQALVASEDTAQNGSTVGGCLIRVDILGRPLSEVLLEELLDLGDTSGTTDENDLQSASVGLND